MAVYRFRVLFEDNEDVCRDIDIKSTQTFEDLHTCILQSIGFDTIHNASFFISDDQWRKGEELVLKPSTTDESKAKAGDVAKRLMGKCKIAALIDDPHQKFVYIYDPKTSWTFMVELVKILPDDDKKQFPLCSKSLGEAPKQYKKVVDAAVATDEDDFDDETEEHADEEAYSNANNDEEIAELEGEEGEEDNTDDTEEEHTEDEESEDEYGFSEFGDGHSDNGDD